MNSHYTLKLFLQFVDINCEVIRGRLPYSFENFTQITQKFVISSSIDDIETILPFGNIPCVYLHDVSKRLLAKTCYDASFMCFLDLLHFVSL